MTAPATLAAHGPAVMTSDTTSATRAARAIARSTSSALRRRAGPIGTIWPNRRSWSDRHSEPKSRLRLWANCSLVTS